VSDRPLTARSTYIPIPEEQIDVWFADLDAASHRNDTFEGLLSFDERNRAGKFHADVDRRRFIASRGILRTLLGRYFAIAPQSVTFSYGPNGKPALPGCELHFNLSHSFGRALFAFGSQSPLGVDLELVRTLPDLVQLGASVFSPTEAKAFATIDAREQPASFFKCWTRKEALIKALGTGLSYPLEQFSVSFDEPARLLSVEGDRTKLTSWRLHHLEPELGYFAAIATQQAEGRIVLHPFELPPF